MRTPLFGIGHVLSRTILASCLWCGLVWLWKLVSSVCWALDSGLNECHLTQSTRRKNKGSRYWKTDKATSVSYYWKRRYLSFLNVLYLLLYQINCFVSDRLREKISASSLGPVCVDWNSLPWDFSESPGDFPVFFFFLKFLSLLWFTRCYIIWIVGFLRILRLLSLLVDLGLEKIHNLCLLVGTGYVLCLRSLLSTLETEPFRFRR